MYGLIVDEEPNPYTYGHIEQIKQLAASNRRHGHTTRIVVLGESVCDSCGDSFPTVESVQDDYGRFCSYRCQDEAHESWRADSFY